MPALMNLKFKSLTPETYRYVIEQRSCVHDPVLDSLWKETEALGDISRMQISAEQGSFMTILVAALGVRSAIEIGTFTGYSSICIARGLPSDGRLICCDVSEEWTSIARRYWARDGVQAKIDLRLGPGADTLRALPANLVFDFAFIDADKTGYDTYFELLLPKMKPNALFVFDNMFMGIDKDGKPATDPSGRAIHELNRKLARDPRVESVLIPVADGLMVCRKK
jgi:caffeoyl-CoA O-methyltransferase